MNAYNRREGEGWPPEMRVQLKYHNTPAIYIIKIIIIIL